MGFPVKKESEVNLIRRGAPCESFVYIILMLLIFSGADRILGR